MIYSLLTSKAAASWGHMSKNKRLLRTISSPEPFGSFYLFEAQFNEGESLIAKAYYPSCSLILFRMGDITKPVACFQDGPWVAFIE